MRSGKTTLIKKMLMEKVHALKSGESMNIAFINVSDVQEVKVTRNPDGALQNTKQLSEDKS